MEKENIEELKVSQADIIEALNVCLRDLSPLINPSVTLKNMTYYILKMFFIDKKKYVIANCPTGSGKTIIGFMVYFCIQYIRNKQIYNKSVARPEQAINELGYFLTPNKVLQEQIANDITRFQFEDYLTLLKGTANYSCIPADELFKNNKLVPNKMRDKVLLYNPDATFASYEYRPCANYSGEKLKERFAECIYQCPYKVAREEASTKSCTILNYAYFLNVMRPSDAKKFFIPRIITICDEAHLIPNIVCNTFNFEFTQALIHRTKKLIEEIIQNFGSTSAALKIDAALAPCFKFFFYPINRLSEIIKYFDNLNELSELLKEISVQYFGDSFNIIYGDRLKKIKEQIVEITDNRESLDELINNRPSDVYYESERVMEVKVIDGYVYKHIVKDLKEAELVKKHLLSNIRYGLFMSATLGNMEEFAELMGMDDADYGTLRLPSTFDFSKSPIYMCDSGYLNYNNFANNIDKVLNDTIRICNTHPNEKGVIHTGTFKITLLLKDKIYALGNAVDTNRFLFYQNTKEKEMLMETFKNSNIPYIFVGPSLYEGIDLPDDKCRFQILVKVPYSQMDGYTKEKKDRYPFWYKRDCIEKIVQAIGRSNRHKNDYSTVYLMDTCFDKIIYETNDEIVNRLEYRRIY